MTASKILAGPVRLLALDEIADGDLTVVDTVVDGDPESLVLYREGASVRAWLNICPHAGRRLDWSPGRLLRSKDGHLVCAAHGASFELAEGRCMDGPCRGDMLRPMAVDVRDGEVWLHG